MNNIKTIIMFRHGETTIDKTDPNRSLTQNGIIRTIKQANVLKKLINTNSCEIFSTNTIRTIDTAKILARELSVNFQKKYCKEFSSFLINRWDLIKDNSNRDLTDIYMDLVTKNKLPLGVVTPSQVSSQFLKVVKELNTKATTIVLVANGGSIEVASYFQKIYKPIKSKIKILNYSDYIFLSKC